MPGICLALLGFLLTFGGIMMVAMSEQIRMSNYKQIRAGGAITLVLGVGIVTSGFVYQYAFSMLIGVVILVFWFLKN